MRFVCTQENLKRGLSITTHLAGRNQNLPILNNVLLETKNGVLILSSTNLEIGIKSQVRGKVEEEGSLTVPAKLLFDYIQSTKNEKIELKKEENNLKVINSNSQTIIKGLDASEFPLIPVIDKKNSISIKKEEIKKALSQVLFAAAVDSTRPEISGVLFDFNEDNLIMAATDSYRLAEKKIKLTKKNSFKKKIVIPSFTLQEINRILSEVEGDVDFVISLNDNQVLFEIDSTSLVSRIIEGEYPDYKQVIPTETKTEVILKKEIFKQSVKAASLFCRQGINDIHFIVLKDKVEIKALNDQVGENQSIMEVKTKGEENDIVFNYHYVLDVLNSITSEEVVLKINNNTLPGIIKPKEDEGYLYIIMPIKQ